jgi:transcriptional regulator with PAS, ATPase and Fis domain
MSNKMNKLHELLIERLLETFVTLVAVDENARIVILNKKYADILGVSSDDAIGKPVESVIPGSRMPWIVRSGETEIASVFVLKNGRPIVCSRLPILDGDKIIGAVSFATFTEMDQLHSVVNMYEQVKNELKLVKLELRQLRGARYSIDQIIGETPSIILMKDLIKKFSKTPSNLLISGETGTGKELVANALHQEGPRYGNSFIRLNCAAIPKDLLESELFGYEDGAFTGAKKGGKLGKVQAADKGTLLLDEINELPLALQAKLLRVIQEREIDKLGGLKSIPVDFRLICSANKSLPDLVATREFREDLYYRINVLEIFVPPLRERRDDIPLLVRHFIGRINAELGLHVDDVDDGVLDLFRRYDWPGNVRQLAHALERAANLKGAGSLSLDCFEHIRLRLKNEAMSQAPDDGSLTTMLAGVERDRILSALTSADGNKAKAAKILKMDRSVLYDKLRKYGLSQKAQ